MPPRVPHLYATLRAFCLGAFAQLGRELARGVELPFSFEAHQSPGRPSFYEYRPLVRGFIEERAARLARGDDARLALDELGRLPAAAIFARAHVDGRDAGDERALLSSVLMPLLQRTAEACGGFDWDDDAFDRAYEELESALFRERHAYAAVAPLVGLSLRASVELCSGLRVREAATGEVASLWPEAQGLLPRGFGREPDRLCLLELELTLPPETAGPPDAPGEVGDAISAIRLATEGAVAAGPVLFERLDWRPFGIRPVLAIAATVPSGEAVRLDVARGRLAGELLERLPHADEDADLAEALDRWELSIFQTEPFRSEQLRESLAALLGGGEGLWAASVRAAVLLGDSGRDRAEVLSALRAVAGGEAADARAASGIRRALVETILHGNRPALIGTLDDALLGLRPRPAGYFARIASAA